MVEYGNLIYQPINGHSVATIEAKSDVKQASLPTIQGQEHEFSAWRGTAKERRPFYQNKSTDCTAEKQVPCQKLPHNQ